MRQLPLGVSLRDQATFDTFHPGPNAAALALCQRVAQGQFAGALALSGREGSGKTHLLQAVSAAAAGADRRAGYLLVAPQIAPEVLDGWEALDVVCLDELDAVAGDARWEQTLFALYNQLADRHASLLTASRRTPGEQPWALADLGSRLRAGMMRRLQPLDDQDCIAALQLRAKTRGLSLPAETGQFLLRRCQRDMHSLYALLDSLDRQSLVEQQRTITIPFARRLIIGQR